MASSEHPGGPLAKMPAWLRTKIEEDSQSAHDSGTNRFNTAAALAGVPEGERDDTVFRLACKLRNADVPKDVAEGLVLQAADNCDPPFPEDEALAKVANAYERYQPGTSSRNYGTDATDATDTRHQLRELSEAPPFPLETLPESCRRLVEEAAASIVCPPEFVAVPLLATLGSAIGMSRVVRLKQGWTESAAIYAAIVALPGTKKTPAFKEAAGPAHEKQAEYRREYREAKRAYEEQRADRREEDGEEDTDEELRPKPTLKRTVVEDTTVEALAVVLEDNPRGVLLARDELSAFVRGMDQYKNHRGSDRQFYLSAWSNSAVSVDRKNLDEPIFLARPFVGVVGSIQPGVLPELIAHRQGREGDGFLDRFLFSYPEPMLSRWSDEEISLEAVWAVQVLYDRLREELPLEHNDNGDPRPREVRLSEEALARFREEVDALREEMEEPDFSNVLRGPWSKLEAYLARLSLVLAMARVVRGPARAERVELEDVEAATSLVEYFKAHARRAYLQLYGESREDRLLADLTKILKENQGRWEDDPKKGWEDPASKLYDALKERGFDALPPRADELSKEILALASHIPVLRAERGKRGNERVLRIWLAEPPAPPAPGVRGVRDDRGAEELRLFFEDDHAAGAARLFGDEFVHPDF
jgi:putative DNA primase/helicase